jgi:hypothetical protein
MHGDFEFKLAVCEPVPFFLRVSVIVGFYDDSVIGVHKNTPS